MTSQLITIPARRGKAARVCAGQHVRIVNTHGAQVVDTWAFSAADPTEWMAMEASRAYFLKLAAAIGDSFVTNRRRPILTLAEDTSGGRHDTLMAACDLERYGLLGVKGHHDNCRDNLHAALAELGLKVPATPSPLNLDAGELRAVPRGDGPGGGVLSVSARHPADQRGDGEDDRGALQRGVSVTDP